MFLNGTKIRNVKPPVTPIKLSDSHGMYLHVKPTGSHFWYFRYYFGGKETRIALDAYQLISLSEARQKRDVLRKQLANNINPMQQRIAKKAAHSPKKCLKVVALSWHGSNKAWSENHATRLLASLAKYSYRFS